MTPGKKRAAITEVTIISGHPGPLARRRQLGAALRRHRTDAGLSLAEVAKRLLLSPSKISRIETAQRSISARDVRDLMDVYRVTDPVVRDELMRLVEESRESAWWAQYNLDPGYERLIGLEGAATTISDYQVAIVPGLLQTPEYAAAISGPWSDAPEVLKDAVDVRIARQQILSKGALFRFVIDEAALHRWVGSREIMRGQIRKIIDLNTGSNLECQVIPYSAGAYQGLVSGFIILQFANSVSTGSAASLSDIVYHEGVIGAGAYIEQSEEVERYLKIFGRLEEKALDRRASNSFMEAVLRGY
ncbi:helix-turn-helix domain-containing protein [Actinoplanes aureus]|uniref:Helix-turn-helix domain-containing protein n=1 Tax=Actinoplanes aureus TaxID=2792083 RepID=A0A931CKU6_9ACTN|nr:helix-turn-helix transcriptional regulator [Actinoplanes aureus]MBG0569243.1 helix-turn-helix domain-containing protein [Actinoplanes aureus]